MNNVNPPVLPSSSSGFAAPASAMKLPTKYPLPSRPAPQSTARPISSSTAAAGATITSTNRPLPASFLPLPLPPPVVATQPQNQSPLSIAQPYSPSPILPHSPSVNSISPNSANANQSWTIDRLDPNDLQDACERIDWGNGWNVEWRKWSTDAAVSSESASSSSSSSTIPITSLSTAAAGVTSDATIAVAAPSKPRAVRLACLPKRARAEDGSDDERNSKVSSSGIAPNSASPQFAFSHGASTQASSSSLSTSASPLTPLSRVWNQLIALEEDVNRIDPVESACRLVRERARLLSSTQQDSDEKKMTLFSHVDVEVQGEDIKGKGRERDVGQGPFAKRDLWVFALVERRNDGVMGVDDEQSAKRSLESLEFDHLTCASTFFSLP